MRLVMPYLNIIITLILQRLLILLVFFLRLQFDLWTVCLKHLSRVLLHAHAGELEVGLYILLDGSGFVGTYHAWHFFE